MFLFVSVRTKDLFAAVGKAASVADRNACACTYADAQEHDVRACFSCRTCTFDAMSGSEFAVVFKVVLWVRRCEGESRLSHRQGLHCVRVCMCACVDAHANVCTRNSKP